MLKQIHFDYNLSLYGRVEVTGLFSADLVASNSRQNNTFSVLETQNN